MSVRPGYDEPVVERGRAEADAIVAMAAQYSDTAHRNWDVSLRWAIQQDDRPPDPELTAQQEENTRRYHDLVTRCGDDSRPILYLVDRLGGDAYDHPARRPGPRRSTTPEDGGFPHGASMRDQLDRAAEQASCAQG